MHATLEQPTPRLPELPRLRNLSPQKKRMWRRFGIALAIVVLLHLFFFFFIAPYLELDHAPPSRTEVVEISPQELAKLKQKVMANKDKYLPPLLKQELHEEYKTKEAPKDAKMMGAFNQTVPKEKVAGAQHDEPLDGGGGKPKAAPKPKLDLAQLGLGTKLPKPVPQEETPQGPQGPNTPFRPVGRDDKNLEHGDQNMLNAVESKFYSFFARLEEPIIRNWFFLLRAHDREIQGEMAGHGVRAGAELPITVEFALDREGNFHSITVVESSGIRSLDEATKGAIQKLGALPNPPPDLFEGGQYYTRQLRFMVHVTDSPMINQRPDLSW